MTRYRNVADSMRAGSIAACLCLAPLPLPGSASRSLDRVEHMANTEYAALQAAAAADYTLEFCTLAGPQFDNGVHERHSCITLNSRDRTAAHDKHRSQSDEAGEPIGEFRAILPAETFDTVLRLVRSERLADLPAPSRMGPGVSLMTLAFRQGATTIEKTITSREMASIEKIDGLIAELGRIYGTLDHSPLRAVRASVAYVEAQQDSHFVLRIDNIGKERVCLRDPHLLSGSNPDAWAGVQVAEFPPEQAGVTAGALQWNRLELAVERTPASGPYIRLDPDRSVSARTVAWKGAKGGMRYLAQGLYTSYTGPADVDGCYQVRGAAFSDGLEVTAPR
jgi:hypothetical protein